MHSHTYPKYAVPFFPDFDCTMPTMQALILDYLATHKKVTFIDLEENVPGFFGDFPFKASSNRKTILWDGVSRSALHALHELEIQGKIQFKETDLGTYQQKGRRLYLSIDAWESEAVHWTPAIVESKVPLH